MTDDELKTLGAKAAALPNGRNELSPKPLGSVTAQALVDPEGRIRVYNSAGDAVVTIKPANGDAIAGAGDLAALQTALQNVLTEAGIATFS